MMDISKQQRWVILILVGALISGAILLTLFRRPSQDQIITLGDGEKTAGVESNAETVVKVFVHVCGAVQKPGVYELPAEDRVFQAIDAAGGTLPQADTSAVNLAARINDGEQIYLPKIGETPRHQSGAHRSVQPKHSQAVKETPKWPLDLNQVSAAQLDAVPGIGPSMAARIIAYREQSGSFTSIDELAKVSGIGEKKLEQFRAYLCVR